MGGAPMGAAPMDPNAMGGAPMDPNAMGGAPMDPSMGGAPMDPSMGGAPMDPSMGGMPSQEMGDDGSDQQVNYISSMLNSLPREKKDAAEAYVKSLGDGTENNQAQAPVQMEGVIFTKGQLSEVFGSIDKDAKRRDMKPKNNLNSPFSAPRMKR